MKRIKNLNPSILALLVFSIFIFIRYKHFITTEPIDSIDLHAHIDLIKKLKIHLFNGNLIFYDNTAFTGWPVLVFYSFLPYVLTALISIPMDLFTNSSVTLSAHLLIVTGLSLLNFIIFYAALPFINDIFEGFKNPSYSEHKKEINIALALFINLFTFWFIKHNTNLGAAGIIHIGYYNQLFGWFALFLYIGLLYRYISKENNNLYYSSAISVTVLLLTHNLTVFYALCIGGLTILWFSGKRFGLLGIHFFGVLLASFWLFPLMYYIGDYTVFNPILGERGPGLIKVFFEYPLYSEIISLLSIIKGNFIPLDYTNTFILILVAAAIINKDIRKSRLISSLIIFTILIAFLLINDYAIASLPLSIHYYRLIGFTIIIYVLILSVVCVSFYKKDLIIGSKSYLSAYRICMIVVLLICFVSALRLPNEYLSKSTVVTKAKFSNQHDVLEYLKTVDKDSRVYFENFADDNRYPPDFSDRYLPSVFNQKTGIESVSYTFIEQSVPYRLINYSTAALGANTYSTSKLNTERNALDSDTLISQLRSFGITHIVAGSDKFTKNLQNHSVRPPVSKNNYQVIKIQNSPNNKIEIPSKTLVGFVDIKGSIKFSLLDYYFYISENLTKKYELLNIENIHNIPEKIDTVIVNHLPDNINKFVEINELKEKKIIFLNFEPTVFNINHYNIKYPHNIEKAYFLNLNYYLNKVVRLPKRLQGINHKETETPVDIKTAKVSWNSDDQKLTITGLVAGMIYRINYTYFPYFHTGGGKLYRGSKDRMYLIPGNDKVAIEFNIYYSWPFWIGVLFTMVALVVLVSVKLNRLQKFKVYFG
ncbi:MAG: hypothetical protein GWN11_12625 [Candidatus Dadabacteria bacterium]|nr:hypothetical protein [Candidatus Dadabacteria bacterium]NIX16680.1 hypothetical protein [Candidatus Dadabacteria bacterium]